MAYFLKNFPMTEYGKGLMISDELKEKCRVVYRKCEDGWRFCDLWNKDVQYDDECIVLPLTSTYGGTEIVTWGTIFTNVIGSMNDPKPRKYSSWIALLKNTYFFDYIVRNGGENGVTMDLMNAAFNYATEEVSTCCTDNFFYNDIAQNDQMPDVFDKSVVEWECNGSVVGGHVIIGEKNPRDVQQGMTVALLPICNKHNIFQYPAINSTRWGTSYYMKMGRNTTCVLLMGFMEAEKVLDYLKKHPLDKIAM